MAMPKGENRKGRYSGSTLVDIFQLTELLKCHNPLYVKRFVITQTGFPQPTNADSYANYELWLWRMGDVIGWRNQQQEKNRETAATA